MQTFRQITGTVFDKSGEPLIGATVQEKASGNGTITNVDGKFSLSVPSDGTIVVSYIGYQTQQVAINDKNDLVIVLDDDAAKLDEVVVVGYGAQKKESVVGAISQVSSKELLASPAKVARPRM